MNVNHQTNSHKSYSRRLTLPLSHHVWFVRIHEDSWWFTNHFRKVCKSLRFPKIHSRITSEWFANHQGWPQNHFRMVRHSPQNHLEWFMNYWDSMRFTPDSFQNGSRFTPIISEWFEIHQDLAQNHFRMVRDSQIHMKMVRSYLFNGPQPNDTYILKFTEYAIPDHFPTRSKPQA